MYWFSPADLPPAVKQRHVRRTAADWSGLAAAAAAWTCTGHGLVLLTALPFFYAADAIVRVRQRTQHPNALKRLQNGSCGSWPSSQVHPSPR
ncbi:uncharacterized protein LAJ45_08469 [Morchella importuna]|uniref:uncharacterized protein n=1 Tax=Morchella importuna TaxID=1174673 RepID=UPI001E8E1B71|nr:uncharacterized protein LAJ45_08469 [Morchella importuna]KAH8147641.1 hypothetical protein LAJ45_08469 [Morchella importuna]